MHERETLNKYAHHVLAAGNPRCAEGDGGGRGRARWVAREGLSEEVL